MSSNFLKMSIIISTYNQPSWLEKVLWGFYFQKYKEFEILIADDGSTIETEETIKKVASQTQMNIKHIWQEDKGFRKCKILNKAIVKSQGNYLVFTDGDCIPRNDFTQTHFSYAQDNYYLSGGYFKLPLQTSQKIQIEHIKKGLPFSIEWLNKNGVKKKNRSLKLQAKGWKAKFYNFITPTHQTWNGHNASTWKKNLIEVNGFNEKMHYGGEDCELGDRLKNNGIKSKQIRYSAICIHLEHPRNYIQEELLQKNKKIRQNTQKKNIIATPHGIQKNFININI